MTDPPNTITLMISVGGLMRIIDELQKGMKQPLVCFIACLTTIISRRNFVFMRAIAQEFRSET